ncbi:MAG: GNAT family N-acetyltransferase [Candidatus Lokiarchaeota archaeon]|nr:GNAT family N-acetyltransferase [Candidatus Lokiarchaeota archaeon]
MSDFTFRVIKPIDWNELSDFFKKNWQGKYHFKVGAYEWDLNYTKWAILKYFWDENLLFGMYKNSQLIGLMYGCPQDLILNIEAENSIPLKGISITYTTIDVNYRKKGLLHQLLTSYIEHVKNLGYDIIISFAIQRWEEVLGRYGFNYIHDDPQFYIKFLSKEGVDKIRLIRGLNRALVILAKTMAGIPDSKLPFGRIIDGSSEDAGRIVNLLNSYQKILPLTPIWSENNFKNYLKESIKFFKSLDLPQEFCIKLWESEEHELLAVLIYNTQRIYFVNGSSFINFIDFIAFHEKISEKEYKRGFIAEIWKKLDPEIPLSIDKFPYNDLKARKAVKSSNDRDPRRLFVLPITNKGQKIFMIKKMKEFFLLNLD